MSMVYLANVPCIQSERSLEFYTSHGHATVEFPSDEIPSYAVLMHWPQPRSGWPVRTFKRFDEAMDFASSFLKQAEPA